MSKQYRLTELYKDEDLTPDDEELFEEYNRIFIENWTQFRRQISNFIDWEITQDIVQYCYIRLLHRGPEQARNLKQWIQSGIKTTAIKYHQRYLRDFSSIEGEKSNVIDQNAHDTSSKQDEPNITLNDYFTFLPEDNPEERLIEKEKWEEQKQKFLKAYGRLNDGYKRVILEYKVKDKSAAEVADKLGIARSTVRCKASRAMKQIREAIKLDGNS